MQPNEFNTAKVRKSAHAKMPTRVYDGDAGFDLYYTGIEPMRIQPDEVAWVPSRVAIQWPDGAWGFVIGRSSSFAKGLLVNPTIIDAGYRGDLGAFVRNVTRVVVTVEPQERVAQVVPLPLLAPLIHLCEVDELDPSDRGWNGFGSSGR